VEDSRKLGGLTFSKVWLAIFLLSLSIGPFSAAHSSVQVRAVPTHTLAPLAPTSVAVVSITPSNVSDSSLISGPVSYTVNVVNSSAINLFDVRLTYNYTVLHGASIDSSSNVLGSDAQVLYNCLDGVRPPGACDDRDGPGITHFGLFLLGNVSVTPPPTGVLFKITFNIVGPGFSQLHLVPGGSFGTVLLIGRLNVALRTQDGYFNNKMCGLLLCKPPVADFTFSPSLAVLGRTVTFNATRSRATNANAVIRSHFWTWGDEQNPSQSTENVTTHAFRSIGNFSVTLAVTDSYGISWSETLTVPVISVYIQLLVDRSRSNQDSGSFLGLW